jgi:hypothetical protein
MATETVTGPSFWAYAVAEEPVTLSPGRRRARRRSMPGAA